MNAKAKDLEIENSNIKKKHRQVENNVFEYKLRTKDSPRNV